MPVTVQLQRKDGRMLAQPENISEALRQASSSDTIEITLSFSGGYAAVLSQRP